MNLEYEFTLKDDLDAMQTFREWSFNRLFVKWIIWGGALFLFLDSAYLIFWGINNPLEPESIGVIAIASLFLIGGILFFYVMQPEVVQSSWIRRATQKQWQAYYERREERIIILTEQEFIFKTSDSEIAWSWQALKLCYEGNRGFMLTFFSGHSRCISKRVFVNQLQIDNFKYLVQEYQSAAKRNE